MSDLCKICGGATHESWCDGPLYDRIKKLEAERDKLRGAIAIAEMNLPCHTQECQEQVKAGLKAALEPASNTVTGKLHR
jgi:hypothetical protein